MFQMSILYSYIGTLSYTHNNPKNITDTKFSLTKLEKISGPQVKNLHTLTNMIKREKE